MRFLLNFLSLILHPLIQGWFLICILLYSSRSEYFYTFSTEAFKGKFLLFGGLFLLLIPGIFSMTGIWLIFRNKNFLLLSTENRLIYYISYALFFLVFWLTIKDLFLWKELKTLIFSGFMVLILMALALPSMKLSAHAAGSGILLFFLIILWLKGIRFSGYLLPFYFPLTGAIGSLRLIMREHTLSETMGGYFTGFIAFLFSLCLLH